MRRGFHEVPLSGRPQSRRSTRTLSARGRRARARRGQAAAELLRVYEDELARTLRAAAELRCPLEERGDLHAPLLPPGAARRWRAQSRRLCALAAQDGLGPPEIERLVALAASPRDAWPRASVLACEALLVRPGAAGTVVLASAKLAEGCAAEAERLLGELLRRGSPRALRWRALEELAALHEERGRDRLALGACTAAAREAGCGAGPLVSSLFLALALGRVADACTAAERLDRALGAEDPALEAALRRTEARVRVWHRGWAPPEESAALFRRLRAVSGSASGALCRALSSGAGQRAPSPS